MSKIRFRVRPERYEAVLGEISEGSEPGLRFYVMMAISTMIASFGLITNSTAVIIGAMLVAPLMTPSSGSPRRRRSSKHRKCDHQDIE